MIGSYPLEREPERVDDVINVAGHRLSTMEAVPERLIFADVLPKTPSGKIMRRLLKEIMATGEIGSDVTALEDATSVEKLKALVKAGR